MIRRLSILCASALAFSLACQRAKDHPPHGGSGHDHATGEHTEGEELPTIARTRWTAAHELFVEFTAPTSNKPVAYHAHVTELSKFAPVTEGTFRVRFRTANAVAREVVQSEVTRPGIFAFEGPAPPAGTYTLEISYQHGGATDVFDCGPVTVTAQPQTAQEDSSSSAITFTKEAQWKIPFATAWAEQRSVAAELEIAATVEAAGGEQSTISAPTGGRFFHNPKLALAEGLRVPKGTTIGTIAPTVSGEDYGRLEAAVEEARLAREQLQRELSRIEPLVRDALLPERRLIEVRDALETQTARFRAASARLGRVAAPPGASGLPLRASTEGLVSEVLVSNGETVEAGAPLVRLGGTEHLWVRARFIAKPASLLQGARPSFLSLSNGERVDLQALGARFLSALPVVDSASRIAVWVVDLPPVSGDAGPATLPTDLRPGASVVLAVSIGSPVNALVVPREAVVEISTRPYVFVQVGGEHFEKRAVTLGPADGPWIRVLTGLAERERVVTKGGYDIHLASLLGTMESHRH